MYGPSSKVRAIVPGMAQWVITAPKGNLEALGWRVLVVVLVLILSPVGAAWDMVIAESRNGNRGARKCISMNEWTGSEYIRIIRMPVDVDTDVGLK